MSCGLDESWRQQPGTPVYAADFDAEGVRRALAKAQPQIQYRSVATVRFAEKAEITMKVKKTVQQDAINHPAKLLIFCNFSIVGNLRARPVYNHYLS